MKKKKEERAPILYEKYKQKYEKKEEIYVPEKSKRNTLKWAGDFIVTFILLAMAGLSTVGVITLLNPQMRYLLLEFIGR